MSSIYDWSLQAANNANADDNINWAEGQPPSSVNNSSRAMMQRVKEFVTDIGGIAKAEGMPNLLTTTVKSPFAKYADGIRLAVRATNTNTAFATLNVNSIGAKPIYCVGAAGLAPVAAGQIQAGGIYEFIYLASLADNAGGWFLLNATSQQALPTGLVMAISAPIVPAGCLYCNGQAVSRTGFAALFGVIGTRYGEGDKSTTFNVPDYRGIFPRGWDDGRGVDPGRAFGTLQWSQNLAHKHSFSGQTGGGGAHHHGTGFPRDARTGPAYGDYAGTAPGQQWRVDLDNDAIGPQPATSTDGEHSHAFSGETAAEGGNEARPINTALYFVIKT